MSKAVRSSDFNEINKAIESEEVLYRNHVATRDLFFNGGLWWDCEWDHGRFRFYLDEKSYLVVIHIVNDNTLVRYDANLCDEGTTNYGEAVYKVYAGPIFKNLVYYGTPSYYTYQKDDNKIFILSTGDIYTITNSGLIKDGETEVLSKYDPQIIH